MTIDDLRRELEEKEAELARVGSLEAQKSGINARLSPLKIEIRGIRDRLKVVDELLVAGYEFNERYQAFAGRTPQLPLKRATHLKSKLTRALGERDRIAAGLAADLEAVEQQLLHIRSRFVGPEGITFVFEEDQIRLWSLELLLGSHQSQEALAKLSAARDLLGESIFPPSSFERFLRKISSPEEAEQNAHLTRPLAERSSPGDASDSLFALAEYVMAGRVCLDERKLRPYLNRNSPFDHFLMKPLQEANTLAGYFSVYRSDHPHPCYVDKSQVPNREKFCPWYTLDHSADESMDFVTLPPDLHEQRWSYYHEQRGIQTLDTSYYFYEGNPNFDEMLRPFYAKWTPLWEALFTHVSGEIAAGRVQRATWGTNEWHIRPLGQV